MFKRKSTQGLLFKTLLCVFILTFTISTIKCDSIESVTKPSEESTEISKETERATDIVVKSEGKDIYIVFNDTDSSTEVPSDSKEDLGTNSEDNLKAIVPTQETQLSAVPLGKFGDLGGIGHGHGGHGGGHKKKKIKIPKKKKHGKGGFGLMKMLKSKYMLIPQLIMLGFSPIILANLKMMVMHALMINNMALSTAVFMLIRNMVFGPSPEAPVKYHNVGYQKPSVYKHYIPPPEPHHPPVVHHSPPVHHAPPEHHHVYHPKPHIAPSHGPWPTHSHVIHIQHHPPPPPPPPSAKPYSAESHSLEPQFNIHALTQETYNKPSSISSYSTGDINTFQPESGFSSSDSSFKGYEYKDNNNNYRSAEVEISPSVSSYFPSNEAADHHALVDGNYFNNDHERSSDNDKEDDDSTDIQSSKSHPTTTVDSFKQYSSMKAHASYRLSAR